MSLNGPKFPGGLGDSTCSASLHCLCIHTQTCTIRVPWRSGGGVRYISPPVFLTPNTLAFRYLNFLQSSTSGGVPQDNLSQVSGLGARVGGLRNPPWTCLNRARPKANTFSTLVNYLSPQGQGRILGAVTS